MSIVPAAAVFGAMFANHPNGHVAMSRSPFVKRTAGAMDVGIPPMFHIERSRPAATDPKREHVRVISEFPVRKANERPADA